MLAGSSGKLFDPARGAFTPVVGMRAARFKLGDAVVPLGTGAVLVAGGDEQVEVYDPRSRAFRTGAGSVGGEWQFATATRLADGHVLIAGGYDPGIHPTAGAWLYHPEG